MPHSWRLDAEKALAIVGLPSWTEADGQQLESSRKDFDDAILARKDAPAAYHLACVIDDAASGVNLVTRAADLRSSTPIQRLLQELLGLPEPIYLHHPIVVHADGRRLAKRDLAPTLAAMRESGIDGRMLARQLLTGEVPSGFRLQDA
jgi:glutamyl-Q tRNA(Asp) synthetase